MTGDTTNQIQPIIDKAMNTVPVLQTGRCRGPRGKIVLVNAVCQLVFLKDLQKWIMRYAMIAKMFFNGDCFLLLTIRYHVKSALVKLLVTSLYKFITS